ncbi:MAG: membrane-bound ClpP family serine protease [Colwellia sp.]|jgi:membrane-bound ClpP family serine protease
MCKFFGICWLLYSAAISAEPMTSSETLLSKQLINLSLQEKNINTSPLNVPLLTIKGAIRPAISDYLVRETNRAKQQNNIPLIMVTLDTPGWFNYAGIALLLLGIVLIIMESMIPSFSVFGIAGIGAFVIDSIFLFDTPLDKFNV